MTVYVESNFLLELAFLQEEYENCQRIIEWAQDNTLELIIPAFCIGEPYGAWIRRAKRRRELKNDFIRELKEMSRSEPYSELRSKSEEITGSLIESIEKEKARLDRVLKRAVAVGELIPMEADILTAAIGYQDSLDLSPPDSIVYASVISHLSESEDGPKCFLDKNAADFANPDIEEELNEFECELITHFGEGFGFIHTHLAGAG